MTDLQSSVRRRSFQLLCYKKTRNFGPPPPQSTSRSGVGLCETGGSNLARFVLLCRAFDLSRSFRDFPIGGLKPLCNVTSCPRRKRKDLIVTLGSIWREWQIERMCAAGDRGNGVGSGGLSSLLRKKLDTEGRNRKNYRFSVSMLQTKEQCLPTNSVLTQNQ
jgi:hypothetical protein